MMIHQLVKGAFYWFKGVYFFLKTPKIWLYFLVPLLINIALSSVLLYFGLGVGLESIPQWEFVPPETAWYHPITWWVYFKGSFVYVFQKFIYILAIVVVLIVYVLFFIFFASVLGSPFYDAMAFRMEKKSGIELQSRPFHWKLDILSPVLYMGKMSFFQIACMVITFPLNYIPFIGTLLYLVFSAFPLSVSLMAFGFERRLVKFRRQLQIAWTQKFYLTGFGIVAFLSLMPFGLSILTFPLSIVGATLLFIEQGYTELGNEEKKQSIMDEQFLEEHVS